MNDCRQFCTSLFAAFAFILIFTAAAFPQSTLTTNKSDYAPSETVRLQVGHVDGTFDNDTSSAHQPWQVTSDDTGGFQTIWIVPSNEDEAGAFLKATADGQTSGEHAEVFFTDNVTVTNGSGG